MNEIYPIFASAGCISMTPTSGGNILDHLFASSTPEDVRRLVFSALSQQELTHWALISRSMKEVIQGVRQEKLLRCASRFIETVMSHLENQKQGNVSTKTPQMEKLKSTFLGLSSILGEIQSVKTCLQDIKRYGLDLQSQIVDQLAKLPEDDLVCLLDLPQAVEKHPNIDDLVSLALVASRIQSIQDYPETKSVDVIKEHLAKLQHMEHISWVLQKFNDPTHKQQCVHAVVATFIQQNNYEKAARCMGLNAESFQITSPLGELFQTASHLAQDVSTHFIKHIEFEKLIEFVVQLGTIQECKRAAPELIQHPSLENMIQKVAKHGNPISMNILLFLICMEALSTYQLDLIPTLFKYLNPHYTDSRSLELCVLLCKRLSFACLYQEAYQLAEFFSIPKEMGQVIWDCYLNSPQETQKFFKSPQSIVGLKKKALAELIHRAFDVHMPLIVQLAACMHDSDQIEYLKLVIDSYLKQPSELNFQKAALLSEEIQNPSLRSEILDYVVHCFIQSYGLAQKNLLIRWVQVRSPSVRREVEDFLKERDLSSSGCPTLSLFGYFRL